MRRTAKPVTAPAKRGSGRMRESEAALAAQMQQILNDLGELRGVKTAVQTLSAKLDAVLRQVGAPGERDPGDAVPPGLPCSAARPSGGRAAAISRNRKGPSL